MKSRYRSRYVSRAASRLIEFATTINQKFQDLEIRRVEAQEVVDQMEKEYSILSLEYDRIDRLGSEWEFLLDILGDELERNEREIICPEAELQAIEDEMESLECALEEASVAVAEAVENL